MTFSEIQEELLSETPNGYKLENYCHDHNLSLIDFLYYFITKFNFTYITVTNNAVVNHTICDVGKRRSLGDIFLICRHYYPDCTVEEVFNALLVLLRAKKISVIKCITINKHVYLNNEYTGSYTYRNGFISSNCGEYGFSITNFL